MSEQNQVNVNSAADAQSSLNVGLGWQPINTAPEDRIVAVGWVNDDGQDTYDFDMKEDGGWLRHNDIVEHAQTAAPQDIPCKMPSEEAPYTCWMYLPPILGVPNVEFSGTPAASSPEAPLERRVGPHG